VANPGGAPEVGQVSVRVSPNTSKFRRELYAYLKSLKNRSVVKVDVEPDLKKFRRDLNAGLKTAKGRASVKVEADFDKVKMPKTLPGRAPTVPVTADLDGFQKKTFADLRKMTELFEQKVPLTPDGEQFRRDALKVATRLEKRITAKLPVDARLAADARRNIQRDLQRFNYYTRTGQWGAGLEVPVSISNRVAKKQIRELIKDLPRMADSGVGKLTIPAHVDEGLAKGELRNLILELKAEASLAGVEIDVDVNTPALRRTGLALGALGRGLASVGSLFASAGKLAGKFGGAVLSVVGGVATSIASLPKLVVIAVPMIVGLIALASLIAPALALIAGSLVVLPGLIAGMIAPIGVVALGMDGIKKAAERAKPAFDDLKATISGVFEKGMIPAFETINNRLLPGLKISMSSVAEKMSEAFTGVVDVASGPEGLNNLQRFFDNVAAGIDRAKPGLKDFTAGILELISAISEKFPNLGDWFSDMGKGFLDWVKGFTAEDPSTGLSKLDTTISSLTGALGELGGIGFDLIKEGLNNISDPNFGERMKEFISSIREMINDIIPRLKGVFEEVAGWVDKIAQAFDVLALGERLGKNPFAETFKIGKDLFDGKSLKDALGIDGIGAEAAKAGKDAGNGLVAGLNAGTLEGAGIDTSALIQEPVARAAAGAIQQAGTMTTAIAQDIATAAATIDTTWSTVVTTMQTGAQEMQTAVGGVFDLLPTTVTTAFQGVQNTVTAAFGLMVLSVGQQAQTINTEIGNVFNQIPTTISTAMGQAVQAMTSSAASITSGFSDAINQLPALAQQAFDTLTQIIQTAMDQMVQAITDGGNKAVTEVEGWGARIVGAADGIAAQMEASGASIGEAFARGISSRAGAVGAAAAELAAAARAVFPNSPAKEGPFSGSGWVDKSGESIGLAFAAGIHTNSGQPVDAATIMAQNVVDTLNQALKNGLTFEGISVNSTSTDDELKSLKDLLDLRTKELAVQKDGAPDKAAKAALTARIAEMNTMKRQISLQREQNEYQDKYGQQVQDTASTYDSAFKSAMKAPYDFAMSGANQFMDDLGIGGGALTGLAKAGLEYGTNFVFNVSGIGEAMTVQKNEQNKMALAATGSG
jgi:hypothetical protein